MFALATGLALVLALSTFANFKRSESSIFATSGALGTSVFGSGRFAVFSALTALAAAALLTAARLADVVIDFTSLPNLTSTSSIVVVPGVARLSG